MADNINHQCKVCGTGYYACDGCDRQDNWRAIACCPRHAQIYSSLIFYTRGYSTKKDTASYLKSLGVTVDEADNFDDGIKKLIVELIGSSKKRKK